MTRPAAISNGANRWLFTSTIFLSAGLLFAVQPLVAKLLLPLVGGSASVWNVAVVFFQAVLLAGYAFAHLAASRLTPRAHRFTQVGVLALPLLVLPIALPSIEAPVGSDPRGWVLLVLVVMVGGPFFALSSSSPTLQRWFSQTDHPKANDPYFLYAAGNVGSFAALLAYPFVIEPGLPLDGQTRWWAWLYGALVLLTIATAWTRAAPRDGGHGRTFAASDLPTVSRRAFWVLGGFVPSFMMLAVTLHLTVDVAAVPLLWIVPLATFLLSFVVVFRSGTERLMVPLAVAVVALSASAFLLTPVHLPLWAEMGLPLVLLGAVSLLSHGRIYLARPPADRLTGFYMWMSVGGVLGGIAASLVVPVVFDAVVEYPISIILGLLLAIPVVSAAASTGLTKGVFVSFMVLLAFGHGAIGFWLATGGSDEVLHRERTFYGVHQVVRTGPEFHVLRSGTTIHGEQDLSQVPPRPLGYYTQNGPIADVFEVAHEKGPIDVAIIGLGSGGLGAYGRPGDAFTFFEIDQAVVDIARNPDLFTYLGDSEAAIDVVVGDGRIELVRSDGAFDIVVMDAFTSDAIPIHLVTREAIRDYLGRLTPGGVVVVHISNRYVDLEPVLGNTAASLGLTARIRNYVPPAGADRERSTSWVVMGSPGSLVDDLGAEWSGVTTDGPTWTDDFADLLAVLKR